MFYDEHPNLGGYRALWPGDYRQRLGRRRCPAQASAWHMVFCVARRHRSVGVQFRQCEERAVSIFDALVGVFPKMLGAVAPVAQVAEKIDPALSSSVTLTRVLAGVKAASALNFAGMEKALAEHFANAQDDLSTVEEVAKAIAPFLPDAMYVADAASIVSAILQIGSLLPADWQIIKTEHGKTNPIFGEDSLAYDHAPFI